MTVAAVGTFATWNRAQNGSERPYVVAARALPPGHQLSPDDLRAVPMRLPGSTATAAYSSPESVTGGILLGPVGEGELVQASQLREADDGRAGGEVSLALPRDRAVDGRLRSGDRIDVFVTDTEGTRLVLEQVQVLTVGETGGSSGLPGGQIMATVGLSDPAGRADLIQALRAGDVTLVRSAATPAAGHDGDRRESP